MAGSGQFMSGDLHPRASDLQSIEREVTSFPIGTYSVVAGSIRREGRYRFVDAQCSACGGTKKLYVDNILSGKTMGCPCQRGHKYFDPRSETLGRRYDAMIQRCERDTHVSSENYKGRGITVEFESREDFVRWALDKFPDTDFKGLDFDRIDNDGPYSKTNLQVVSRSENLKNTRRSKKL
ncbi:hypothetical protein ASC75_02425 [Aminobacter sp. DSM 101952]|uniref:hypothetical protein n=1 Tax=Aminobacter sp. DSM 101952 TaxID=2735891 RepID=UPI0006F63C23|nr:hypothetical protein [Aminobacter sp. DSM 101952]KQU76490.1 hypothetical protein ASC75_02425 [Aminobacter sp. DSM 101952]